VTALGKALSARRPLRAASVRGGGLVGLAFVLPSLAVFAAFLVLPVASIFLISLLRWAGFRIGDWQFAGLGNFEHLVSDPVFWAAFAHTVLFTVATTVLLNVLGFAFALLVASRLPGHRLAKSVLFLPVLLSPVVVGLMWSRILDAFGAFNQLITLVAPKSQPVLFLGDPDLVLPSIIVAIVWQFTGYNMLLYYAGLQNLPRDLVEAASIDGAGTWASIRNVVIPSLYPVVGTAILLNVIGGLRVFDLVYIMTRGGPNRSSEVMATYMYEQGFKFSDMGYAGAIAVVIVARSIVGAVMRLRWGSARG
jgi:raffinose/stachyose/melibiose transport system permease protein